MSSPAVWIPSARLAALATYKSIERATEPAAVVRTRAPVPDPDRGELRLKGFNEPVRVFEVRWRALRPTPV
ncbi:MAG: hypothetical protein M3295_07320 [Chloroflexota bacterium]|nr:hypothetical protein [Chloroflexota bacterium]